MTKDIDNVTGDGWTITQRSKHRTLTHPIMPVRRDMEPMVQVVKHSHSWGQLVYASQGVMQIIADEGYYIVPPGQALWLPSNVEHQVASRFGATFRNLHIDESLCRVLGDKVYSFNVEPLLREVILAMCQWPFDYEMTDERERLLAVLIDLLKAAPKTGLFMPSITDKRLTPIIEAITAQPDNKKTLEQWAGEVGASSRTLNRLFNQYFGFGFSQWKQKLRIIQSLNLLADGLTTQEIASRLGYESSSAFIYAFKQHLGCSPGHYRKQNQA